jgi:hypothetical protein
VFITLLARSKERSFSFPVVRLGGDTTIGIDGAETTRERGTLPGGVCVGGCVGVCGG